MRISVTWQGLVRPRPYSTRGETGSVDPISLEPLLEHRFSYLGSL